jgi:predicted CXXCH cytochrome family protein
MKKFLLVAILVLALPLVTSGVALANNGPHDGGYYTSFYDECDKCHLPASDGSPGGDLKDNVPDLCFACHGSTANGADTNVEDGIYLDRDSVTESPAEGIPLRGLKGGGFVNALMDTDLDSAVSATAATSSHIADGSLGVVWGNGAIDSGPGLIDFSLSCTSCHDPHGNGNYRTLRPIPRDSGAIAPVNVPNEVTKNYTVANASGQYFGEGYNLALPSTSPMSPQYVALSDWCIQCHTRYMASSDAATTDSGDAIFTYRHMTGDTFAEGGDCSKCHGIPFVIPPPITFNAAYWNHDVECMTCHVAHGCSASMVGYAGSLVWPDGSITPPGNARSSLLRVDNRGTCQLCHDDPHTPSNDDCARCHLAHTARFPKLVTAFDSDGDGIPDDTDACPFEDATGQDADLDGCIDAIEDFPQVVEDLNLPMGTENSLKDKLNNIQNSIDDGNIATAINQLNAFINQVNALRGKKITNDEADMLVQYATNLINSLTP